MITCGRRHHSPYAMHAPQEAALDAHGRHLPQMASLATGDHTPSCANLELSPAARRVSRAALLRRPALRDTALRAGAVAALREAQRARGSEGIACRPAAVMGPGAVAEAGALGGGRFAREGNSQPEEAEQSNHGL